MYRIKNWKKFQHYKDRDPLWIKLHLSLMKDLAYLSLTDKAKITLIHCWMVGAEMWRPEKEVEPLLPSDGKLLKTLLKLDGNIRTNEIILSGYLILVPNDYSNLLDNTASDLLADGKQDDTLELELEKEIEKPKPRARANRVFAPPSTEQMIQFFQDKGKSEGMAMACWDHYQANGWKQSNGNKLKDWEAAARGWIRREAKFSNAPRGETPMDHAPW